MKESPECSLMNNTLNSTKKDVFDLLGLNPIREITNRTNMMENIAGGQISLHY